MRIRSLILPLTLGCCALGVSPARSADASAGLAAAEQAYQEVDFERAHTLGRETLEHGRASRAESARLYVLLGMSAAALERNDEARGYFSVALAIEPGRKLEKNLSPKIRGPYLEAAAALALYQTPLALSAAENRTARRLTLRLDDPLALVKRLEVLLRPLGQDTFRRVELPSRAESALPLDDGYVERGFEYSARALDEFGNALFELGSETDPVSVAGQPAATPLPNDVVMQPAAARAGTPWLALGLGATGLAALGVGVYFQVQREQSAKEWNGPSCEQPGESRGAQCSDVDADRRRNQNLAIASYATGGALLVGGVVAFVLSRPASHGEQQAKLGCGAFGSMVTCSGHF